MAEITWKQAMRVLENVKLHYRVFEHLQEVAELMMRSDQTIDAKNGEIKALDIEKQKLQDEIEGLKVVREREKLEVEQHRQVIVTMERDLAPKEAQLATEHKRVQMELLKLRQDLQAAKEDAQVQAKRLYDEEAKPYHARIGELKNEVGRLTGERDALVKQVQEIKQRIGSL